jgi:hypothetical protein
MSQRERERGGEKGERKRERERGGEKGERKRERDRDPHRRPSGCLTVAS